MKEETSCGKFLVTVWCPICDEQSTFTASSIEDAVEIGQEEWYCRCDPTTLRSNGRYQIQSTLPIESEDESDDFYWWQGDQWESPIS